MNNDQTSDQVVTMSLPIDGPVISPQVETPIPATLSTPNPQEQNTEIIHDDIVKALEQADTETPQPVIEPNPPVQEQPKHAGGRPCEYCSNKDEIQGKAEKYYLRFKSALENGKPQIPYYQELALELDKDRDTLNDWTNKLLPDGEPEHPEFVRTIKKLKTLQEVLLLKRTLGRYNPTGAIFQLNNNHNYVAATKQILAGDKNEPLQIEIIEERKLTND